MINSVRFSIIENDLNREEQERNEEYGDEEDRKSISSEGSGEGIKISYTSKTQPRDYDGHLMEITELELSLHSLTNADEIETCIVSNTQFDFQSTEQLNVALMFAVWHRNFSYASKLLRMNADANVTDIKGRSALHYACIFGSATFVKLLFHHRALVNVWDIEKTVTPLHYAAISGSEECVRLLIARGAEVNSGIDRRSPLHYAVQKNAIKCVELLLANGANPNPPKITIESPLHIAVEMGFSECLKALLDAGADVSTRMGNKRNTALHLAAEDDFSDCVKHLLEAGASVNARNIDEQTPLHVACLSQSFETLELLLKHGADVNLVYRDGRTALHASIVKESSSWDCTRMLLDRKADVNKADDFGYTPLHIAALNEFSSCAYMLIEYGADIIARTNGGVSALSFIVRRTPEVIPKYFAKLDSSIKVNEHEIGDVDCEIKLDFRCLVPNHERGETELLLAFIEVGQKRILKHPLAETFLFLKWRRIRKYFLFSLFYHSLYVLLFTIYAMQVFVNHCQKGNCNEETYVQAIAIIGYIVLFMNFSLMAKEIFQAAHGFVVYVRYWENWLQWMIIFGVFLSSYPQGEKLKDLSTIDTWQFNVAGIVIFFVWLELMMLVGRFPIFGLYVQMFTKVAVNFSKFLLAYCCLLIAFALSFCILFSNYAPFESVPLSILKTIVMMIGELEFEDVFFTNDGDQDQPVLHPITAHIMFLAFVILVTVILMNLLVGLAVSDIQGLQASAGLNRLTRQAELVARLEGLLFSKLLKKAPSKVLKFFRREALLRTSRYNLQLGIKPNDPREKRIPKDIMASIYKLVAERRDRNQSMRRKRNNRNINLFKESFDEVIYRQPTLHRNQTWRQRTISDQPPSRDTSSFGARRSTNDIPMVNIRNQLKEVETKLDVLMKRIDELSNSISKK
ncbi:CLUMA_CG019970, isoform A [Clunio marinus]|uniref:CLUMA_CG019970, isoform A n=1 Tax=Clunio marinus TaxID=568069 RepID=A0A1J1J7Z5_9DIPT|nr:CLUMA_CG019970, isoform A [Clunio marinus]